MWFTLKDTGKTQVFDAQPPFALLKTLDTGPITNHVNIVRNAKGQFAYVTVGGLNEVKVFRTDDFCRSRRSRSASCRTASGRRATAARVYVGLENADAMLAIDTADQQGDRHRADRPGAAGHRLCAERGARGRRHAGACSAGRGRRDRASDACAACRPTAGDRRADQRLAVRPGADPGAAGRRSPGSRPSSPIFWRCPPDQNGGGTLEPLAELHDQPGRVPPSSTPSDRSDRSCKARRTTPRRYLTIVSGTADKLGTPVQVQVE